MALRPGKCLLTQRLKQVGMTQYELADHLKMSESAISNYVTNSRIMSLRTAKRIANVLKCNIDDLYEWIDD